MFCVTMGGLEITSTGLQAKVYYSCDYKYEKLSFKLQGVRKDTSLFAVTKPIFGVSKADCWLTAYSSWYVCVYKQTTKLRLFTVVRFLVFSLSCKITFFTSAYKPIHMCHLTSQVQRTEHVRKSQNTIVVCDKEAAFRYKQLYLS